MANTNQIADLRMLEDMLGGVEKRRPLVEPKVVMVATIEEEISNQELRDLRETILSQMDSDLITDVGADPTVDSIGVETVSALLLDDADDLSKDLEDIILSNGFSVDEGIQIMAVVDRVSVR